MDYATVASIQAELDMAKITVYNLEQKLEDAKIALRKTNILDDINTYHEQIKQFIQNAAIYDCNHLHVAIRDLCCRMKSPQGEHPYFE